MVDDFQRRGRYVMTAAEAGTLLAPIKEPALQKAFQRLCAQGRLLRPHRGFYVIVPLEYSAVGSPPVEWFIDDLMHFLGVPYYVGGLSAATVYGAAHQRIQEMQVVVPIHLRLIERPALRIRFLQHSSMESALTRKHRTHTGDIPISTPEWTALDLIRFQKNYGGLDVAVTALTELIETLDPRPLGEAVKLEPCNACLQRLGWLLDFLGCRELAQTLYIELKGRNPSYTQLSASATERGGQRDGKWHVWINEQPEADL